MPPRARFDSIRSGTALARVDAASRAGMWAYGHLSYDAAPAFDPALATAASLGLAPAADVPLAWFGLTAAPPDPVHPVHAEETEERDAGGPDAGAVHDWTLQTDPAAHRAAYDAIRAAIAAGETYQCNLTTRMTGTLTGDPFDYYRRLATNQGGDDAAWLRTDLVDIASASPECFFRWSDGRIRCSPMKGTAPRGTGTADDRVRRDALLASPKERAENLMIVDLMRNDLVRLACDGRVRVEELFRCEPYDTVWQLTSSVSAAVAETTTLTDVMRTLFPCGSVTGAPKARTMRLIAELERRSRGVYCGAIGWLAPLGHVERARFNVAIRTVVIDRATARAEYGVGGGITWGSTPAAEYEEVLHKTAVLAAPADPGIRLLETLPRRGGEPVNLEAHLERMAASAAHFGFPFDLARLRERLSVAERGAPDARIRLTLDRRGEVRVTEEPLPEHPLAPRTLAIDTVPVDRRSDRLRHKTTDRAVYAAARRRHPGVDDVVLVNDEGNVTETTIASLLVRIGGRWVTPPVSDGCLPGVGRRMLVERGLLQVRSISVAELRAAEAVEVVSSLRGRLPARIVDEAAPTSADAATAQPSRTVQTAQESTRARTACCVPT